MFQDADLEFLERVAKYLEAVDLVDKDFAWYGDKPENDLSDAFCNALGYQPDHFDDTILAINESSKEENIVGLNSGLMRELKRVGIGGLEVNLLYCLLCYYSDDYKAAVMQIRTSINQVKALRALLG